MKKLQIIISLIFALQLNAQKLQIFGGLNQSSIRYDMSIITANIYCRDCYEKVNLNYAFGVGYEHKLSDNFDLNLKMLYSINSSEVTEPKIKEYMNIANISTKIQADILSLSPLLKISPFHSTRITPYLSFGPNIYYVANVTNIFEANTINSNFEESINKWNYGFLFVLGTEYKVKDKVTIDLSLNCQYMISYFLNSPQRYYFQNISTYYNSHQASLSNINALIGISYQLSNN